MREDGECLFCSCTFESGCRLERKAEKKADKPKPKPLKGAKAPDRSKFDAEYHREMRRRRIEKNGGNTKGAKRQGKRK